VAKRARERAKTTTIYSRRIENLPLWFDRNDRNDLPKMKIFVPLFVGSYAFHLSFRVLKTLWEYKVA